MEISYTKKGYYLIPNLELDNKKQYNIEKYGLLKKHNKSLYINLLMKDKLNGYLYKLDKLVNDKVNDLVIQLAEKENVNEELKCTNQLEWVKQMN